jgi:hypothetical protein
VVEEPAPALPGAAPVLAIDTPSALKPLIDALASALWAAAACNTLPPASRATPMTTEPVGVLVAIMRWPQSRRFATTRGAYDSLGAASGFCTAVNERSTTSMK